MALHFLRVVATHGHNISLRVLWLINSLLDTFSFKWSNFTLIYLTPVRIERMWLLRRYQQSLLVPVAVFPGHCGFLRVQQHTALIPWAESAFSFSRGSITYSWSQGQRSVRVSGISWAMMRNISFQTLFQRCEKLRPLLFRLASETVDDDEALGKSQHCPWISLQLSLSTFPLTSGLFPSSRGRMLRHMLPCWQSFPLSPLNHAHGKRQSLLSLFSKEATNFHLEPQIKQWIQFLPAKVVFRVWGVLVFTELKAFEVFSLQTCL